MMLVVRGVAMLLMSEGGFVVMVTACSLLRRIVSACVRLLNVHWLIEERLILGVPSGPSMELAMTVCVAILL